MWCPKCKNEYREGFKRCSYCEVDLVPELPKETAEKHEITEKLVTIASFVHTIDAQMARSRLESSGIECFLADENTIAINWLYSQAIGGIKIQVQESDIEKAKEVLKQWPKYSELKVPQLAESKKGKEVLCPSCNSTDTYYEKLLKRPIFFSWLVIGVPLPFFKRRWVCKQCDHQWKIKK